VEQTLEERDGNASTGLRRQGDGVERAMLVSVK
jgi:hypothetical protein